MRCVTFRLAHRLTSWEGEVWLREHAAGLICEGLREADPAPELWDWTAPAGHIDWPGPARAPQTLQRPPQPRLDPHAEAFGHTVSEQMQQQRCGAGP
eukprot:9528080-Alexandrium_andersonii.AAC.1